jgi:2-oxoglutarate ferredoxin oxidoreductase subunit alpha
VHRAREEGLRVSQVHLRHLNPFPRNLGDVLARYEKVLVPEINMGQLALLLQGRYLKPVIRLNKVQGQPFGAGEILDKIVEITEAG